MLTADPSRRTPHTLTMPMTPSNLLTCGPSSEDPPATETGWALQPWGAGQVVPHEARVQRLRQEREAHTRKQIWTKDAHGGPYRKVNANNGYDPLLQLPDGTPRPTELGYERVQMGPTTNFVGNHMTQGAIDLVQAELEQPATATLLLEGGDDGGQPQPRRQGRAQRLLAQAPPLPQLASSSSRGGAQATLQFAESAGQQQLEAASGETAG